MAVIGRIAIMMKEVVSLSFLIVIALPPPQKK